MKYTPSDTRIPQTHRKALNEKVIYLIDRGNPSETGITQEGDIPWIWLANIDHLYWSRENLNVAEQKLHPHGHGWSIVNNVDQWTWD